ncbi:MAG TPA: FtsQ-type POTRA domain-containing protein [Stenomitos sp.]
MESIASVSQAQLTTRRKQLRRERRIKSVQAIWRSLLVSGMATSLVWAITLPDWVISTSEQIVVEGNHLLSAKSIRSLLPLSYPESILRVEPQAIAKSLESQAPIAEATVTRQLLPPGLTIKVKERQPVAIAQATELSSAQSANPIAKSGFLDAQGVLMPESSYTRLEQKLDLPSLKVIGSSDQYLSHWSEVYQAVSHSPVKVFEIDWRNPANLILKTELGNVHLGPYSSRFTEQLTVLDRMRELPSHIQAGNIAYINLQNPEFPAIQMEKGNDTVSPITH